MAARQAFSQTLKSIAGASLLALGLVLLFASLDGVAASVRSLSGLSAHEAVGIVPTLGLAVLHAAQAYAFDHAGFISAFRQILLSFWPSILIAIGAALLRNALGRLTKSEVVETSSGERATNES
jgi:ascorbate-specific PTS system EIIC-type component UlaA